MKRIEPPLWKGTFKNMLRPTIVLDDLYPPGTAFSSYVAEGAARWLPAGLWARAWLSAAPIQAAGGMPLIVHESVAHPSAMRLLRGLSFSSAERMEVVASEAEYAARVKAVGERHSGFHTDYTLPAGWLPPSRHVVDPALCSGLNNKGMLDQWVPEGFYPRRIMIDGRDLGGKEPMDFPYVVKAVSDFGSGGGLDVAVCRNPEDQQKALACFGREKTVLVEEWISAARLFCVQGAVLKDGSYTALGSSEQMCDEHGRPLGNWVDEESDVGPEGCHLAEKIIFRAGQAGYRGIAGVDILKTEDGRVKAIDLNFRNCHSTKGLLVRSELGRLWNWDCMIIRSLVGQGEVEKLLGILYEGISDRLVYPWSIQIAGNHIRIAALAGGRSRTEAEEGLLRLSRRLFP